PEVVVHHLEIPGHFAGGSMQCYETVAIQVLPEAQAAVIIGAGTAGGDEYQIVFCIAGDDGPGIGRTGGMRLWPLPAVPGRVGRIARDGVPGPAQLAGQYVVRPDGAPAIVEALVIAQRGPYNDEIADDSGWRSDTDVLPIARF